MAIRGAGVREQAGGKMEFCVVIFFFRFLCNIQLAVRPQKTIPVKGRGVPEENEDGGWRDEEER